MKIGYLIPHLKCYGGIRRIVELTNRLLKRHEVTLFVSHSESLVCEWMEVKSKVLLAKELPNRPLDVICFSLEEDWPLPMKAKAKAIVYYILHYGVLYKYPEVCKESYQQPYYQIVNSNWTAGMIQKETGKRPPVVWGGINTDLFHPIKTKKIYDILGYGDKKRPWKGRKLVETLSEWHPEWKIGFLSDINPPQDKIAEVYCSAKIFFSASWFEGWNWLGIESMACGIPLVITDDGGSSDYVQDGKNCLQIPPKDMEKAVEVIEKLLNDKILYNSLRIAGLRTAQKFTWENSVKNFEKHLKLSLISNMKSVSTQKP